jgi:hypothetical protein
MKIIFTILFAALFTSSNAQPVISISHNGKLKLTVKKEDEKKNHFVIHRADLKKAGSLTISIARDKNYIEKIMIEGLDGGDVTPTQAPGKMNKQLFMIGNRILMGGTNTSKEIKIMNYRIPSDPAKAALVRMRPILVCTITII